MVSLNPTHTKYGQYMLGSPFSTNRAKAVLKPSPAPSTNKASLLFWLVQFLAAKQIVGGDNLPCGFLAPSVGFWCDFQHVLKNHQKDHHNTLLLEIYIFHNERSRFELKICFPKCHFLCTKEGLQKLIRETLFFEIRFQWNWIWYACIQGRLLEAIFKRAAQEEVFSWKVHLGWRS